MKKIINLVVIVLVSNTVFAASGAGSGGVFDKTQNNMKLQFGKEFERKLPLEMKIKLTEEMLKTVAQLNKSLEEEGYNSNEILDVIAECAEGLENEVCSK